MGRKALTQEIKEHRGSYRKDPQRFNAAAPKADCIEPVMPTEFNADERQKWIEICADLRRLGVLSSDVREMLVAYCTAYGSWIELRRRIAIEGMLIEGDGKLRRNPLMPEMHKFRDVMNRLLPEFGLTPASRQKLCSVNQESDPFQEWLSGTNIN